MLLYLLDTRSVSCVRAKQVCWGQSSVGNLITQSIIADEKCESDCHHARMAGICTHHGTWSSSNKKFEQTS